MANTADAEHWIISAEDRTKHNAQFEQLKPVNGFVSGDQVKPLLLKSGLPMPVLGHVWNLADMNGDGKMDQLEFSIAIHLIRKRLQGVALPKVLPASLKVDPMSAQSVAQPHAAPSHAAVAVPQPSQPQPPANVAPVSTATASPPVPPAPNRQPSPASVMSPPRPSAPPTRKSPTPSASPVPAVMSPPTVVSPSVGAATGAAWAISPADQQKYLQILVAHDQKKKGYLTGLEARDVLQQSGLNVKVLAQIWNLADIDGDGRLTKDEFCVAMHYVDWAKSGKPVPATLPPEIIPPSCRKAQCGSPASAVPVAAQTVSAPSPAAPDKPVSLPRPTAKPPSDATRVPAIQPPSGVTVPRRPPSATGAPVPAPPQPVAAAVDAFGMDQLAFQTPQVQPVKDATNPANVTSPEQRVFSPPVAAAKAANASVDSGDESKLPTSVSKTQSENELSEISEAEKLRQLEKVAEDHMKSLQEQLEREKEAQRKALREQMEKEKEEQIRLMREQLEKEKEEQRKMLMEQLEKEKEEQRRKLEEQKEAARRQLQRERQVEWEQQRKVQLETLKLKEKTTVEKLESDVAKLKTDLASVDEKKCDIGGKAEKARSIVAEITSTIEQMRISRDQKMSDITQLQQRIEDNNKRFQSLEQDQVQLNMQLESFKQSHADAFKLMVNNCNTKKAVIDQLKSQLTKLNRDTKSRLQTIESNCTRIEEFKVLATDLFTEIKLLEDTLSEKRRAWTMKDSGEIEKPEETFRQDSVCADKGPSSLEGYCLYSAMYEFSARSDDELSLQPGDLVWIKPENIGSGSGWAVGRTDDNREGCFPESYVQLVDESGLPAGAGDAQITSAAIVGELTQPAAFEDSVLSTTAVESAAIESQALPVEPVTVAATSRDLDQPTQATGELYVAMYSFTSNEDGDLTFNEGEVITVTQSDGDWWTGVCGKRTGIFPANFVKKMDAQPPPASKEEDSQKQSTTKKPEIATVIASYEPTSSEQLALQVGQLIQIRKKTDTGWWEGELQVRGQKRRVGWFPANFVKVLGPGGQRLSAEASGKIPPAQQQPPSTSSTAKPTSAAAPPGVLEQAVALYDYQSQQADELGFVKGNVINVLSKEHADWWMGEIDGRTGIFPANFVGPMS